MSGDSITGYRHVKGFLAHSCANDMLDGPADVHQVQAALGHRSLVATQIYLRGRVEPLRAPMGGRRYTPGP